MRSNKLCRPSWKPFLASMTTPAIRDAGTWSGMAISPSDRSLSGAVRKDVDTQRPQVSDDNAFVESLFRTCKYVPYFPKTGFKSLEAAREWVRGLVDWYNHQHKHRGINYVTPHQRHSGKDIEILAKRHVVYQQARAKACTITNSGLIQRFLSY